MEKKLGITETKRIVKAGLKFKHAIKQALEDNKISKFETVKMFMSGGGFILALTHSKQVRAELEDLDQSEYDNLIAMIQEDADINRHKAISLLHDILNYFIDMEKFAKQ